MGLSYLLGGAITTEGGQAKMMGHWHDGAPLIDRPIDKTEEANKVRVSKADDDEPHNDPLRGRHPGLLSLRRTYLPVNPRGSLVSGADRADHHQPASHSAARQGLPAR